MNKITIKKRIPFLCVMVFFAVVDFAAAADALAGNPLADYYRVREGRSMRASSADPAWETGNADWRLFSSNTKIKLAELEGPGIITHVWMTIACKDRDYPRLMALRMYWDGEKQPSVEAPIGDFFAVGHGLDVPVNSLPVQVSSEGRSRNSFWPMPFEKSAKIVVTNENPSSSGGVIYWYVDWVKLDSLPDDAAYFHAQYAQEYPAAPGRYQVMSARGRGHYAGTTYSVVANSPGWIGEGDDFFYIDGETLPSIRGTGTEDYFCDAWGFRRFNNPYHGVTVWEGEETGSRTTAYRWHVADPIIFSESIKFEIEHVGPVYDEDEKSKAIYGERADHYSTVAYWYQRGGGSNWTRMPKGKRRLPPKIIIEAERRYRKAGATPGGVTVVSGYEWGGGAYVEFTPSPESKSYEIKFNLKRGGRFDASADVVRGPGMGVYEVALDGVPLESLDEMNQDELQLNHRKWGIKTLEPGSHTFSFEYVGPSGEGEALGVDALYLRPLDFKK